MSKENKRSIEELAALAGLVEVKQPDLDVKEWASTANDKISSLDSHIASPKTRRSVESAMKEKGATSEYEKFLDDYGKMVRSFLALERKVK